VKIVPLFGLRLTNCRLPGADWSEWGDYAGSAAGDLSPVGKSAAGPFILAGDVPVERPLPHVARRQKRPAGRSWGRRQVILATAAMSYDGKATLLHGNRPDHVTPPWGTATQLIE
jgi:hypothetical protein